MTRSVVCRLWIGRVYVAANAGHGIGVQIALLDSKVKQRLKNYLLVMMGGVGKS
jgi:hypothetical protein